jgi:hypothetical protein
MAFYINFIKNGFQIGLWPKKKLLDTGIMFSPNRAPFGGFRPKWGTKINQAHFGTEHTIPMKIYCGDRENCAESEDILLVRYRAVVREIRGAKVERCGYNGHFSSFGRVTLRWKMES